jgi:hypothetical protein
MDGIERHCALQRGYFENVDGANYSRQTTEEMIVRRSGKGYIPFWSRQNIFDSQIRQPDSTARFDSLMRHG